ncbi:hypothetical protein AAFC00_001160 [Neodothiora populina]|uniref:Glycoside hydrolase 131 catalytic N-terminal domain-containing protein n=1 Tax=Neodothiora populina TaxID=2781224 RepID=A0ABR3PMY8_9PEZI
MISLTPATLLTTSAALVGNAFADVLWDGRFNSSTQPNLEAWSFSNAVGAYQYYIHGSGEMNKYVNFDAGFKNPADTGSEDGVKITLDDTSYWNGQNMRRTELIPETEAAINKGKVYYHFSIKHAATNAPNTKTEHQLAFFESHFTELKSGLMSGSQEPSSNSLHWMVNSQSQWNISDWTADIWHNVAYGIDFDQNTVEFYHSTGADDLSLTAGPISATTSSDGADWHVGALRLPPSDSSIGAGAEDFYYSGVYIESGDVTLSVAGPGGAAAAPVASSPTAPVATAAAIATSSSVAPSSSAPAPTTLQTIVKSSSTVTASSSSSSVTVSSSEAAPTATSAAPSPPSEASEGDCAVEYVYA